MTSYNIALITPSSIRDIFCEIHREVIETIQWGLTALGHDTTTSVDALAEDRTNIVLGFQMLAPEVLDKAPPGTIVYNLEQIYGLLPGQLKPVYAMAAHKFQVWEYSERNMDTWAM